MNRRLSVSIPPVADDTLFRYLQPGIAVMPPDVAESAISFRTAYEIERDRRAAKGCPMPVRDGAHGE